MTQLHDEVLEAWDALPHYTRDWLKELIARDLPDTRHAVLVEVDVARNEDEEDDATMSVLIERSTGHLYGASFVPRPPGARLH